MLAACGDGEDVSRADREQARTVEINRQVAKLTKPTVRPPGEPPKKIVVRDLKEGTGPPIKTGDEVTIEYIGVGPAGKTKYSSWDDREVHTFFFGQGEYFPGWDKGVKGMREGGRREVLFPANLTTHGPLTYVVDVVEIE
jgi:FKBP-type peptidyl-prolyl cis-trans isomerase